jgi:hypothetical protein
MTKNNKRQYFSVLNTGMIFFVLSFFLFGCHFPAVENTIQSDRSQSLSAYLTPLVKVNFNLRLPEPLPLGDKVNIVILDEVTGLPYNRQEIEMDRVDDELLTTTISIPARSVIKYRYEKVGETISPEINSNDEIVRYRMFFVKEESETTDILFSWKDRVEISETGRFEGIVQDKNTGDPIPDILISAGGKLTFSDANGLFSLDGLPVGTLNVLLYAIDGKFETFQQGAVISAGKKTPAEVRLSPNKPIEVTFVITPPNEAAGAPIYLAGNLAQFGNTFTDLQGAMSIEASRMPLMSSQTDGTLTNTFRLYAGTDLRFKFTLGDGYWNAERSSEGGLITRQLIVPDQNVSLNLEIDTWRTTIFEPITFETFIHPTVGRAGERYIQFKTDEWTEPIPLWPLGNGDHLYILFSPFEFSSPISYRVCLNKKCEFLENNSQVSPEERVEPTDKALTRVISVNTWIKETPDQAYQDIYQMPFPYKSSDFQTMIEFSPDISPAWSHLAPIGLQKNKDINTEMVIFSPQWFGNESDPWLKPEIGKTPFTYEIINYIRSAQSLDLETGLFPQFSQSTVSDDSSQWSKQNQTWQKIWFDSYQQMIINYAKIAEFTGADSLIVGGNLPLPIPQFENTNNEGDDFEEEWISFVDEIRDVYHGNLQWAVKADIETVSLPSFIDLFDEIYISIDSPIYDGTDATFDEIAYGFTITLDNIIYEVYRSTMKPITIALAYPSVNGSLQGCLLIDEDCNNDGLFLQAEVADYTQDNDEQAQIYNAILHVALSREWITGISIRGYQPAGIAQDLSSSISSKPAQDVIEYWYTGIKD